MKILYVSTVSSRTKYEQLYDIYKDKLRPSIQNFHYAIVDGLAKNDCEVTALCGYQVPLSTGKKIFTASFEKERGIEFVYPFVINCKFLRKVLTFLFFCFYTIYWIIKNTFSKKRIIIDASFVSVSPVMVFIANLFSISITGIVADVYDYMSPKVSDDLKKMPLKKIIRFIANYCWKNYDSFVFLTEEMNSLLNINNKPYIVMEGIYSSDRKYKKSKKNDKKIIMYSGSINSKYGINKLVDAFKLIHLDDVELHLYGHTNMPEYLDKIQAEDKRITYFGVVSISEIRKKEMDAYILVNPRPTIDEYTKYSFPSKTMEYMATGNIFITTKLNGIPQEYDEYLNYFSDETIEGMSKDLIELLDNKHRKELQLKSKRAQDFILKNKNNIVQTKKICDSFSKTNNLYNHSVNILIAINYLMCILGFAINNISIMKISLIFSFIYILIDAISFYKKKLLLVIFLISFFVFSMGQYFFPNVTNDSLYYTNYPSNYVAYTFLIQYLSLVLTYYGFVFFDKVKVNKFQKLKVDNYSVSVYHKIIFALMIITFVFSIITNGERAIFAFKNGYLSIYNGSFTSIFPSFFYKIGSYFYIFFTVFLVFCCRKKDIYLAFILHFIISILSFIEGGRFELVSLIFFVGFYIIYNIQIGKIKINIKPKKLIFSSIVIAFVGIIGLSFYNRYRNSHELYKIDPLYEISSFFVSQGRSINLVTNGIVYQDELKSEKTYYVFGQYIQSLIDKINYYSPFKIKDLAPERKLNYAKDISLLVLRSKKVSEGHGLGTQYMAELYLDYGLLGVCVFSFLLGYFLNMIYAYSKDNFIMRIFLFSSFSSVLHICRGAVLDVLSRYLSITYWGLIIILLLLNRFLKKGEVQNENIMDC